jgi:hypothetical protein
MSGRSRTSRALSKPILRTPQFTNPTIAKREDSNMVVIEKLELGDLVMNLGNGLTYIVVQHFGDHAVAVRSADVSNPQEWKRMTSPSDREIPSGGVRG